MHFHQGSQRFTTAAHFAEYVIDAFDTLWREGAETPRMTRAWAAFARMMQSGPAPGQAAADLRRALLRRRSGTVRTGRCFQAVLAPLLSRLGSLGLRRRIQAGYFDVT